MQGKVSLWLYASMCTEWCISKQLNWYQCLCFSAVLNKDVINQHQNSFLCCISMDTNVTQEVQIFLVKENYFFFFLTKFNHKCANARDPVHQRYLCGYSTYGSSQLLCPGLLLYYESTVPKNKYSCVANECTWYVDGNLGIAADICRNWRQSNLCAEPRNCLL